MPSKKDEITYTKLLHIINNNDYEKLEEILYNNPNINIDYKIVNKAIENRVNRCFDLLINYENIKLDTYIFNQALDMCKVKNEENKYYIDRLLEKNIKLEPYDITKLIDFDYNIYYNYVEKLNVIQIKELLSYLTDNTKMTYFFEQFNKLSKHEQIDFVKDRIYTGYNKSNIFIHFMKSEEYDYNTLMYTSKENEIKYCLLKLLCNKNNDNITNTIVNYLINKPIDLTNFENELSNINSNLYKILNNNNDYWQKKILKLKHKLVINCPKIKLFNITSRCNNGYLTLKTLYYYYKFGFNFDIYSDFNYNFESFNKFDTRIINIISFVQFGRFIGQDIPEHLKEPIYKFCKNSPLLDITPTEKNILAV